MTIKKTSRFTHFDELLSVRMGAPVFMRNATTKPHIECDIANDNIDDLLDLGFIFSHQLTVNNAVGKDEGDSATVVAYIKEDDNAYALVTNLYHEEYWVYFASFFADGSRILTTSQPGTLTLEQSPGNDEPHYIQNAGSAPVTAQWKRHKRFLSSDAASMEPLLFTPDYHVELERNLYHAHIEELLAQHILQQSDTQTVRFTRSGARSFHMALTSRSAKRPKPRMGDRAEKRHAFQIGEFLSFRYVALATLAVIGTGIIVQLQHLRSEDPVTETLSSAKNSVESTKIDSSTDPLPLDAVQINPEAQDPVANIATTTADESATETADGADVSTATNHQGYLVADGEDEMWRIAVENAEFFLLSSDGDPAPWVRTARKIAAGFDSGDSRLARTYFLSALLESNYRIAEQQFNRALSIQTKTLGLYHAETAQTLEALAWIAEHNKDDLKEAITHQRLAINIYHDIFGPDSEDTKAAEWKLAYFEDRQAGIRPKAESNRRLLPALARFSR